MSENGTCSQQASILATSLSSLRRARTVFKAFTESEDNNEFLLQWPGIQNAAGKLICRGAHAKLGK